jgi:hypothetical protein
VQDHVEVSDRFATVEDMDAEADINSASEMIREHIKISAKESLGYFDLRKHMPWFDEVSSAILDRRKQVNCSGYRSQVKKMGII